ncbi:MAG: autotransporter outer membrane beta-barrel domain-containing protein [Rhizobiales bacterium]|nr:autotransporter outer membrane beta-barrel domain-containing protein [Hyphomicrobiales bacterium]
MRPPSLYGRLRRMLLGGAALAAVGIGGGAQAQTIDTTPVWNGSSFISSWGVTNTATYGQTITGDAAHHQLTGFTFYINSSNAPTPPQYQAYVYQWDSVNQRVTGPALYTSAVMTAPGGNTYVPVTFNTGTITLTSGQQYVLMLTTSGIPQACCSAYRYGSVSDVYSGGKFVFINNGPDFNQLGTVTWSSINSDLAFIANMLAGPLSPSLPAGAPVNATNVARGIDNAVAGGAQLPAAILPTYVLVGQPLVAALNQLSGENNTATQEAALQASSLFLNIMLDPMAGARGAQAGQAGPSLIQMADLSNPRARPGEAGWSVWTKAFAQSGRINGDANFGSGTTNTGLFGVAAGADKRISADTLVGFALAGGGTAFGLNNRGNGTGNMFQIGLYGSTRLGDGYVSAALAYGWNAFEMNRTAAGAPAETYMSRVTAQTYGGRIETGWRFGLAGFGVTPYAAIEAIGYSAPSYGETFNAPATGGLALTFAGRSTVSLRTELGARLDAKTQVAPGSELITFGRLAWGYQAKTDRSIDASFQSMANSGFTVFGARPSTHTALASIGAELRLSGGMRLSTSIDGELGDHHRSIRANAGLRYSW